MEGALGDRVNGLVDEFNKQNRAWRKILAPHTRVGTWSPDGQQPANAPGAPVNVVFEPSKRKIGNLFATAQSGRAPV
ncbi:hypothetical protein G6F23_016103 [Rhizopus arrhizus]|nr:hypothetical protein G6F23_016103 [Rhizopus arrhizus]